MFPPPHGSRNASTGRYPGGKRPETYLTVFASPAVSIPDFSE
jgi:hypothetical protein